MRTHVYVNSRNWLSGKNGANRTVSQIKVFRRFNACKITPEIKMHYYGRVIVKYKHVQLNKQLLNVLVYKADTCDTKRAFCFKQSFQQSIVVSFRLNF